MHISRRLFPGVATFESGNRLVCSEPSCRWASHSCFKNSGCCRLISSGVRCGAPLVEASSIAEIPQVTNLVNASFNPPSFTESTFSNDPLDIGLLSASACKYLGPPAMESEVLNVLLDHVMVCPVSTISHVPRSVRPLLAHVLSIEFQKACSSVWGFVRLFLFAKVVLRTPGGQPNHRRRFVISSILLDRLHMWSLSDGIKSLWSLLQDDLKVSKPKQSASSDDFSKSRDLFWAHEGRYSNALQSLNSVGVAGHDDDGAYQDLLKRHPYSSCPIDSSSDSSPLTIDESMVLSCLQAFPKGTSPGASKLRAQHLLDAVAGSTAPAARECLLSLTRFMNHLLSGRAPSCLAPWLCGAPLTVYFKKVGCLPNCCG